MIMFGVDAHKRSHTIVAVDDLGKQVATITVGTTTSDHLDAWAWSERIAGEAPRRWAVEDCRHLSRRLERDLLAAGEQLVRVPPKLMAHMRDSARTYGKSDPIDALAIARAALREPGLPVARLDGPEREVRLLVDFRDSLVAQRTSIVNALRWNLHELDPATEIRPRGFRRLKAYRVVQAQLENFDGTVARLAAARCTAARELTVQILALEKEITALVERLTPTLLQVPGCAGLTAAKILGETAGIARFHSPDAYARHNGTAPLPVWSSNVPRHRLSRTGNRQLNAALHRIALTQARHHPPARTLIARRKESGKSGKEALRILKRHLSNVVFHTLTADAQPLMAAQLAAA
ncbi:MAG TPA: IS110 family transposase [Propionibacteriaceae bacterium]|nr:IS110 family transposase [Propionibacteriaceae bacterium]